MISLELLLTLPLVGLLAGFIDTLAGGGGLLTLPALTLAGLPPAQALGTNKLQASCGTLTASLSFMAAGRIPGQLLGEALISSGGGALLGAATALLLPSGWLELIIPLLLLAIGLIMLALPQLGEGERRPRQSQGQFLLCFALPLGFYDGFLGPGTGSFFLLALVLFRGRSLQQATIEAKTYNFVTNLMSLLLFAVQGQVLWLLGLAMGLGQMVGARLAVRLVLLKGNRLIRPLAIGISMLMSLALMYRYWF